LTYATKNKLKEQIVCKAEGYTLVSLKSFPVASFIQKELENREVFATVTEGKYKGSVGRIADVIRHHYDRHEYVIEINNVKMNFCGSKLKESSCSEVKFKCDNNYVREYFDFNGKLIELDKLLLVSRRGSTGSQNEMVIGNVRKIEVAGVFVEPFAINGCFFNGHKNYMRLTKTNNTIMLDSTTQHNVLLNRLSASE
jgi:hypothetical protein